MHYRKLGRSGLVVSRLALGSMTFGPAGKPPYKVDQQGANALVGQALDAGVNFFNSADAYARGQSEEMLGQALGAHRCDVVLATKVGNRSGPAIVDQGLSRRHIFDAVDASLRRLRTDYIDVYLAHRVDVGTPLEESLDALDHLVRQGKVLYLGFSNWPAWLAAKAIGLQQAHGWNRFVVSETYYSLVGRDVEHEFIPFSLDAEVGMTVWSPLAMGLLSGRYRRDAEPGDGGRLESVDLIPFDRELGFKVVDRLADIAADHDATPAQVAIAWLLAKPCVTSVILGASSTDQLADNLGSDGLTLADTELVELDQLTAPAVAYPAWLNDTFADSRTRRALEQ